MPGRFNVSVNIPKKTTIYIIVFIVISLLVWFFFFNNQPRSSFGELNAGFLSWARSQDVFQNVNDANALINYIYDTVNVINTNGPSKNFKKYFSGSILNIDKTSLLNAATYLSYPSSTFLPLLASQVQNLVKNIKNNVNSKQKTGTPDYNNIGKINEDLAKIMDISNENGVPIKDLIKKYTLAFKELFSQFLI